VTSADHSVFVNCPFDDDYKPLFEAMIFTIASSGYRVRCALEENNSADIRFDKLCRLISESERSVHDLSRVELDRKSGLPRFNMPFELGLFLGARRFGAGVQRKKSALVMTSAQYRLPVYLSDTSGSDTSHHGGEVIELVRSVRGYLHAKPDGRPLPGAARIVQMFSRFKTLRPDYAAALDIAPDELDPFRDYRDYGAVQKVFLRALEAG
jgi:hypothetical protein